MARVIDFAVGADTTLPSYDAAFTRIYGSADLRVLAATDRVEQAVSPERILYVDTDAAAPNTGDRYRVEAVVATTGSDSGVVGARANTASGGNGYFLILRPSSSAIIVARLENGLPYGLSGGPISHSFADGTYAVAIEVETIDASTVRIFAYLDGVEIGSVDDISSIRLLTGRPLIGVEGNSACWLDDYTADLLGGSETPVSVGGALSLSGSLIRQVSRALTGGATPAGALTRRGSRTLAGASTPSGALSKRGTRSPAGTTTPNGTLVRRPAKLLTASLTPSGTVTKRGTRALAGATTPTGALSAIRAVLTSVAGALVLAGTVTARLTRALVAAIAPSGALTKRTATSTGGTIAPSGAVAKRQPRAVVGAITPGGLVWRRQDKPLAGAVTPAATLATQLNLSADLLQLTFVPAVGPRYTIRYPSLSTVLTMTSFAPEFIPLGTDAVLQLRGVKVFNPPTGTRVPATGITITAHLALTPTGDPIHATLQVTLTERTAGEWYGVLQGSASEAHLRALLGTLIYVVLRVGTDDYLGHFPVRVVDGVPLGA